MARQSIPVLAPGKVLVRSPMGGWEAVLAEPRVVAEKRTRKSRPKDLTTKRERRTS